MKISYTILTLKETPDRLQRTLVTLNKAGIEPKVFYGLNNNKTELRNTNKSHRLGLIGCWVSHMLMWQNSINDDSDWCVFMEDDMKANSDAKEKIEEMLASAPEQYEVVFPVAFASSKNHKIISSVNHLLQEKECVWSTVCYAIRKSSLIKMIDLYNISPVEHIDIDINKKHRAGRLKVCYAKNNVGELLEGAGSSVVTAGRLKNAKFLFGAIR